MTHSILHGAKQTLERRRQSAVAISDDLRRDIYSRIPVLSAVDERHTRAASMAAKLSLAGQRAQADECVRVMREITQQKEIMLEKEGYSLADLKPKYGCGICNDRGYDASGNICNCLKEEINRLRRESIHGMGLLKLCSFDGFSLEKYPESLEGSQVSPRKIMTNILRDCEEYATGFGRRSPSLFMFGDAGLGKTHLALSAASEILNKGFDVIYVSSQSAFSQISAARYGDDGGLFCSMLKADLLVLDDLGTEYIDAYIVSKLYELVNSRTGRPTIYTSNICSQDMLEQRYTEKIVSRLLGDCHPIRLWGNDIRLEKLNPVQSQ